MTKEVIKVYFPYLKALADDKEVQCDISGEWKDIEEISFSIGVEHYRIKPKSRYRPFKNQEECWQEMLKHQPFGWIKGKEGEHHSLITSIIADEEEVYINGISGFVLDEVMEHYTFADGLPFGVKDE